MGSKRVCEGVHVTLRLALEDAALLTLEEEKRQINRSAVIRMLIKEALGPKQKALQ